MSVDPVFVASRQVLLDRVRLDNAEVPSGVIDQAMEESRLWLYNPDLGLGPSLIASLLTLPSVENPSTTDQLKRANANVLEVLVFRRELLLVMPVLFMDANATHEAWNQEQFSRQSSQVRDLLDQINLKIMDKLQELQGEGEEAGSLGASAIGPSSTPPSPRDSIRRFQS